mgnify:FL=1
MATLEELTTPLTSAEIKANIYAAIEAFGAKTTSWKPGAVARTIIAANSIVLSAFSTLQQRLAQSGFLELATGQWLTIVAKEVYNVTRDDGSFAAGDVTLTNTAGGVYPMGIGDVIVLNTTTSKTYRNTEAFTLAAFGTEIVNFEAVELGADSTANPGDIDALETVLTGVTVTNVSALVGKDAATDAELRTLCLAKTGTLSPNGPADAYRFVSLSAETTDGESAGVTRITVTPDGAGNVRVVVANGAGTLAGTVGDLTTPLGAVDEAIQTQVVPLAVTTTTFAATPQSVPVTYEVWVKSTVGLTETQLGDVIDLALTNYMATVPIGGTRKVAGGGFVFKEAVASIIGATVGQASLIDFDLDDIGGDTPEGDLAILTDSAPVQGTITRTINVVSL